MMPEVNVNPHPLPLVRHHYREPESIQCKYRNPNERRVKH